jgi:RNA polymerase-binding transcription factor DksA
MFDSINTEDFADAAAIEEGVATSAAVRAAQRELKSKGSENCQGCGCVIPKERREFLPSVQFCAPCQKEFDAGRRFILGGTIKDIESEDEDDGLTAEESELAKKIIIAQME